MSADCTVVIFFNDGIPSSIIDTLLKLGWTMPPTAMAYRSDCGIEFDWQDIDRLGTGSPLDIARHLSGLGVDFGLQMFAFGFDDYLVSFNFKILDKEIWVDLSNCPVFFTNESSRKINFCVMSKILDSLCGSVKSIFRVRIDASGLS